LTPLERLLRVFTDIRPGEGVTGLLLFVNVFLVLCAYYFVKPLRDGWIAVSSVAGFSTMELKAYSSFGQSLLLLGIVSVYARLSVRWPRNVLITRCTLFCMSNLVIFWLLYPGFMIANLPGAGIAFYLWVGMFGVFIVAQFWTFAADLYAGERGSRLLPLVAIGATAGAAFGSLLTQLLVSAGFTGGTLLLLATVPLGISIVLTRIADARGPLGTPRAERVRPTAPAAAAAKATSTAPQAHSGQSPALPRTWAQRPAAAAAQAHRGALRFVLQNRYLLAVAAVAMLTNWVNTDGENLLFRVVQENLNAQVTAQGTTDPAAIRDFVQSGTTLFYGSFLFWVNACALVSQGLLASRLLKYGGFGAVFLMLPAIALISYSTMAFIPLLAVVRVMKVAENATDYSINNTARQVVWLPTTAEMKYRAKPAVDSLFVRMGDGLAALTVLVGVHFLDLSTRSLFIVNIAIVIAWLAVSVFVVREHKRLAAASAGSQPA